jgi:CobQ-like glutamine amidotransferase family enzyme
VSVAIALLFPDLLGTYGDSGNAVILAQRLRWRGIDAEVLTIRSGEPVPESAEVYVVGGGEDLPQVSAARQLRAGAFKRAVESGAVTLAVCAGVQIVGQWFLGAGGERIEGAGILDCTTTPGPGKRAVGEILVEPAAELGLPVLTGYENHAGATTLGPAARPLGRVIAGLGNNDGSGTDGALQGRLLGTYLHGPVLARNPALADLLLSWVVGSVEPLDDTEFDELRRERINAVTGRRSRR